ncbi:uncharacterized protein B0J16DRAFT_299006 [Fusarium flagelliforme]|uniref:uncharacterized protein n=1 Tax=Fusarium flagelliforme TaxID=2675880 RepID=UPI001E8E0E94|nr:uncharacterized protein B0J16DRAFT_299006 [Fusarium flagelliforme]KAH7191740.1 hypothetical protein B0J16DRAFT_299006 [Fusarium flagelliforme]
MSGPELGLAIWAAVDLGLKWGNKLIVLCHSIKNAPNELAESVIRVETCWVRISHQLEHTKQVVAAMEAAHQELHLHTLDIVLGKLQAIYQELSTFSRLLRPIDSQGEDKKDASRLSMTMNKTLYAFRKKRIDDSIGELEKWQSTFDISWLLILKTAEQAVHTGTQVDTTGQLSSETQGKLTGNPLFMADTGRAVFLRPERVNTSTACKIAYCESQFLTRSSESFVLDSLVCSQASKTSRSLVMKDMKSLAQKLHAYEGPGFGLLKCKGVLKQESREQGTNQLNFTFVFQIPRYLQTPRSLRELLLSHERPHSLSDVIRIGRELAKAVSYVHILDFVHKNIRPESILLLRHTGTEDLVAYLVGFQKFRRDGGLTSRIGASGWQQTLYCHPRRYGTNPEDAYVMQHDIYSLGVCLLEIGLWESFVIYTETGETIASNLIASYLPSNTTLGPETLKQGLVTLARTRLPGRTGNNYAEIVETCLTCLDENNIDFGDESEFLDADGILVGIRYIEKVITKLDLLNI